MLMNGAVIAMITNSSLVIKMLLFAAQIESTGDLIYSSEKNGEGTYLKLRFQQSTGDGQKVPSANMMLG